MIKNRNKIIDTARGIGIILVSMYHLIYRSQNGFADVFFQECMWLFIPFCFLISGFNHKTEERTLRQKIECRIKHLFIPAFLYTISWLLIGGIYCRFVHEYSLRDWLRDIIYTYLRPEFSKIIIPDWGSPSVLFENISAVWFVWAMMFMFLIFYPLVDKVRNNLRNLILSIVILLSISVLLYDFGDKVSWSLTTVPLYAAITLCGAYIAANQEVFPAERNSKVSLLLLIFAIVVHVVMFRFCQTDLVFMNNLGTLGKWSVFVFFAQTFIGGYALMMVAEILNERCKKFSEILMFIGRNSLCFLILHCAFGMILADLMHTYIKPGPNWYVDLTPEIVIKSLIGWILSLILCAVLCLLKNSIAKKWRIL